MARIVTKLALYALALVAIVDVTRYRRRQLDRGAGKGALMTWEDEGGSVPPSHWHEPNVGQRASFAPEQPSRSV
jgi:hypothetical protein